LVSGARQHNLLDMSGVSGCTSLQLRLPRESDKRLFLSLPRVQQLCQQCVGLRALLMPSFEICGPVFSHLLSSLPALSRLSLAALTSPPPSDYSAQPGLRLQALSIGRISLPHAHGPILPLLPLQQLQQPLQLG
jgi:hypothetical protein